MNRFCLTLGLAFLSLPLWADEAEEAPATVKAEKGPFKIEVVVKGIFEADKMFPIAVRLDAWSPQSGGGTLMIKERAEHGSRVKKGDVLIKLDLTKIDEAIADLITEQALTELALKRAEEELPIQEKSAPLKLAIAEYTKKKADDDLKRFVDTERAHEEKMAHFQVKNYRDFLEYEKEELRQLEKMYKADDLTEETEEIILKRQRNTVEMTEFFVRLAEKQRDDLLKLQLPRQDRELRDAATKESLELEELKVTVPLGVSQSRQSLAKLRYDRDKARDRLAKLKRDRDAMLVVAPSDGVVYYGRCTRGQWSTDAGEKLVVGAALQPDEVVMTVVSLPGTLTVRGTVEEADLQHLKLGMKGKVSPAMQPDLKLPARLAGLSLVPVKAGEFDARVLIDPTANGPSLMPGMACTTKFVPVARPDVLTVPAGSVFEDELDDERVYVLLKGEKPARRYVKVGVKSAERVEILEGLKAGDEILKEKPGEVKKPEPAKKEGE